MLGAARRLQISAAFTRAGLSTVSGADTKNIRHTLMTDLVAELADVDDIQKAKREALCKLIEKNQFISEEGETGEFCFDHKGTRLHVEDVEQQNAIPYVGIYTPHGNYFEYNEFRAIVQTSRVPSLLIAGFEGTEVIAPTEKILADVIFDLVEEGKFCRFCGQLVVEMSGDICLLCAKTEMKNPCRTCGKRIGRSTTGDTAEHPTCKKRRLNLN